MNFRAITLVGTLVSMVTGIAAGIALYERWYAKPQDDAEIIAEALRHIERNYVDDLPRHRLVRGAISGMLEGLDPHTTLLGRDAYARLQDETSGSFTGIGIELGLVDGYFTVITPIDGSPASRAGLQSGDRLIEVDNEPLAGTRLQQAVRRMRGPVGSDVHLRVKRGDSPAFDVNIQRAVIDTVSVTSRWLEPGIAYVRINQFRAHTGDDFANAVAALTVEAELEGLVLDLRNNPGGVLQASVAVADALLEEGLIVYTQGRLPSSQVRYSASGGDIAAGAPIVVLINGGSASASEVVAGALRDHNRATLMGTRSYGKGSVQSVIPLAGSRALKLTTAYYYTPNGNSIHEEGIAPDVEEEANGDALLQAAVSTIRSS